MGSTVGEPLHFQEAGTIPKDAPWRWFAKGWEDFKRDPMLSMGYGLLFVVLGYAMSWGLWALGMSAFIPVAIGAFVLIAPLMAVGLYEMSKRIEAGETFTVTEIVFVKSASPLQLAYIGFLLMFAYVVWARIAMMLYALMVSGNYMPIAEFMGFVLGTPQGLMMLVVGTLIGGTIGVVVFAFTAFSIPILMDRRIDAISAIVMSIGALAKNQRAAFLWAWIIAGSIVVSAATFGAAFVVLFPVLGHATWHAYREAFPIE